MTRRISRGCAGSATARADQRLLERPGRSERVPRRRVPGGSVDDLVAVHARVLETPSSGRRRRAGPRRADQPSASSGQDTGSQQLDVGDGEVAGGQAGAELPDPAVQLAHDDLASTARAIIRPRTLASASGPRPVASSMRPSAVPDLGLAVAAPTSTRASGPVSIGTPS